MVAAGSADREPGDRRDWNLCGGPRHRLPCHYLPLAVRSASGEADAWRQTRRREDQWSLPAQHFCLQPAAKHTVGPDRGHAVSKTPSKAQIRKISLWPVRWQVQSRMFVVSRVVTTDYMCGPALSGFWQELWPPSVFTDFRDGANYRNSDLTVVLSSLPLGQNVTPFPVKVKRCIYVHRIRNCCVVPCT